MTSRRRMRQSLSPTEVCGTLARGWVGKGWSGRGRWAWPLQQDPEGPIPQWEVRGACLPQGYAPFLETQWEVWLPQPAQAEGHVLIPVGQEGGGAGRSATAWAPTLPPTGPACCSWPDLRALRGPTKQPGSARPPFCVAEGGSGQ